MYGRTRRGNRLGLALLGVLSVLAGAAVILAHTGVFGRRVADTALYPVETGHWLAGHRWSWWVVAVLAAVAFLIGLRWLLVQLRSDRISRIAVEEDTPDGGRTALQAAALADAVSADAEAVDGVRSASAAVIGSRRSPELWLTVTLAEDADSAAVRTTLLDQVVADARRAVDRPGLLVYLTLDVSRRGTTRTVA